MFKAGDTVFIRSQRLRGRVRAPVHYGRDGRLGMGYAVDVEGVGIGMFHENDVEPVRILKLVVDNDAPLERLYAEGLLARKPRRASGDDDEPRPAA